MRRENIAWQLKKGLFKLIRYVPAERFGVPVLDHPKQPHLAVLDGGDLGRIDAHIRFGALVMICRSCGLASRVRARCGDSRPLSRISRNLAHTLRWPSRAGGHSHRLCSGRTGSSMS
jgi:hypothetical protein